MKSGSFLTASIALVACSAAFAEDIREKVRKIPPPQENEEPVIDIEGVVYGIPFGATEDEVIAKFGKPQGYIRIDDDRSALLYGRSHLLLFHAGRFDAVRISDSMIDSRIGNLINETPPFTGRGWQLSNGLRYEMNLAEVKEVLKDKLLGDKYHRMFSTDKTIVELRFAHYTMEGEGDRAHRLHGILIARKHDGHGNWSQNLSRSFGDEMKGKKMLGFMPRDGERGIWIIYVFKNSPADRAGLRPRDLITKLNGESIAGMRVTEFVEGIKKLDSFELEITSKDGTTRTVRLQPADASTFSSELVGPSLELLHLDVGDEAPDFEATAPDGKKIKLSEMRGAPVLVNFTATWCVPCKKEMPSLVSAHSKYKEQGFRIISVYLDEADKDLFAYAKGLGADWPIHSDGKGWENVVAQKYGAFAVPRNVLVGKDGKILETNIRGGSIDAAIEAAL